MTRIAIIGSGITGMGCAHFLHRDFDLTLFEEENRLGGHANTVSVTEPSTGAMLPIDTGFMVFNQITYPLLTRLFQELRVPIKPASMSFAVRDDVTGLEWCGSSLNHLFAQRRNLFRPRFWRMLRQIDRFNREAMVALHDPATAEKTLRHYIAERDYGPDFCRLYILPMSSAVWSAPPDVMMEFPASTLLRFFFNHGFLGLHTQHPWWTVVGGSREYVARISEPWKHRVQLSQAARKIRRARGGVFVETVAGASVRFDHVIVATPADRALSLLTDPSAEEASVLGAFKYQPNLATLHTDESVMPRTARAWASWNYRLGIGTENTTEPATHYWMNSLQGVSRRQQYFVSINGANTIAEGKVLRRIAYRHPLFDLGAVRAQDRLCALNAHAGHGSQTFFGGAYARYGFHEDGLQSAYTIASLLLGRDPWPMEKRELIHANGHGSDAAPEPFATASSS
jgi:predicted NAD/FAD-binding protein